mmetsp:Transcript_28053/g.63422  ORF Transcript_28053/g.63422 Transcript_28053/m.63422 type:complete len:161 (-) Transcript_28053:2183-2665(-)
MYNEQRTFIPNHILISLGLLGTFSVIICLGYTYKLLQDLNTDTVNPVEVCDKVNHLKIPEYIAHLLLSIAFVLRGWWVVGFLNFPFMFYNFAQWYEGKHQLDPTQIFNVLSRELRVIKAKSAFFLMIVAYSIWEWIIWVPPDYVSAGEGYHVVKQIQVSH